MDFQGNYATWIQKNIEQKQQQQQHVVTALKYQKMSFFDSPTSAESSGDDLKKFSLLLEQFLFDERRSCPTDAKHFVLSLQSNHNYEAGGLYFVTPSEKGKN